MKTFDPKSVSKAEFHGLLLSAIAPRPIAFASTIDKAGNVNLSPFSYFNVFSANPPILVFSPARRVRDNTIKHTLENMLEVPEVVINVVNYDMVEQTSLASTEYDEGVNEFIKAGLKPVPSTKVAPPRVAESPAAFECVVKDVISLGDEGGAGNLVICEVLLAHINEAVFDSNGKIDQHKIDLVARMGGNWYCRAQGESLFEIPKPIQKRGIGVDEIPKAIRESKVLTGNNLGRLGNVEHLPSDLEVAAFAQEPEVRAILDDLEGNYDQMIEELHKLAQNYINQNDLEAAWKTLLQS